MRLCCEYPRCSHVSDWGPEEEKGLIHCVAAMDQAQVPGLGAIFLSVWNAALQNAALGTRFRQLQKVQWQMAALISFTGRLIGRSV